MMNSLYIANGSVVLENEVRNIDIRIINGKITFPGNKRKMYDKSEVIDAQGLYVFPGFIDTHVHGGGGSDFMDLTEESFKNIVSIHAFHGTTSIMPTTLSATPENIELFLNLYGKMKDIALDADLLGVHLEGPFLSPNQTGAQNKSMLRLPTKDNIRFLEKYKNIIKRIDIAPELEGAMSAGKFFSDMGAVVSIGHSDALFDIVEKSLKYGFSHVTHMHCSSPWARKINEKVQAGIPEAAYLFDDMSFELIGDGLHIAPQTIEMAAKFKQNYKVSLVTDAMRAAGSDVKESYLGMIRPENRVIIEGGVAKLPDRSSFAGSIATMDKVFFNALNNTKLSINKVCELTSMAAAVLLGVDRFKGSIAEGKDADIVIADVGKSELRYVISNGRIIRKTL